jgi:hypothetical protein
MLVETWLTMYVCQTQEADNSLIIEHILLLKHLKNSKYRPNPIYFTEPILINVSNQYSVFNQLETDNSQILTWMNYANCSTQCM